MFAEEATRRQRVVRAGLVCWHRIFDPTSALGAVPDKSNKHVLQLGPTTGADAEDPAWGVGGKGLGFVAPTYCLTENLPEVTLAGPWTAFLCGLFNGATLYATLWSLADSAGDANYHDIYYKGGGGKVYLRSYSSDSQFSGPLDVSTISPCVLVARTVGTNIVLTRMDTGAYVTAVNKNPTGTARLGIGARATATVWPVDAMTAYECLLYSRSLSNAEIWRMYREIKRWWAGQGVAVL